MKYIKSSGGYYYKELSNGKRSRVSAEEYNTKKQKFMNKQGGGSGYYMKAEEERQQMMKQAMAEQERLNTLTPKQIKKENEEKKLKLKQDNLKREKDLKRVPELIEEFEKERPEKAKGIFSSTREKLYEVMYEIIQKAENEKILESWIRQKMYENMRETPDTKKKYTNDQVNDIIKGLNKYIKQHPQPQQKTEPPKFPIIYLGDLFDSSCKGKCTDSQIINRFSFNIRNIKYLKDHIKKFQIFLGNRDINKLKLLELLKFKEDKGWNDILIKDNIVDAAKELVNTLNNSPQAQSSPPAAAEPAAAAAAAAASAAAASAVAAVVAEKTLQSAPPAAVAAQWKYNNNLEWDKGGFKPYWNKEKWKNWENDFKIEIKTCNQMFDRIFGADPKTGTMSAGLLKDSIYNEITQLDSSGKQSLQSESDLSEFKSAVALVVFKLLMMKKEDTMKKNDTIGNNNISYKLKQFVNDYSFVDLLLQNNVHFCKAIDNGNNILCFSHSGIQENIMTTDEFNKIEINKYKEPKGGKITGITATVENVNNLNEHLKKELEELINSTGDDIPEKIYKFLYISAGFKQKSPIVVDKYTDFIIDHNRQITENGKNTIQFTGHQPVGIATLFNISRRNNDNDKDNYNMVFSIDRYNNVDNLANFKQDQYNKYSSNLYLNKGKLIELKTDIEFNNNAKIFEYNSENTIKQKSIKINNQIDLENSEIIIGDKILDEKQLESFDEQDLTKFLKKNKIKFLSDLEGLDLQTYALEKEDTKIQNGGKGTSKNIGKEIKKDEKKFNKLEKHKAYEKLKKLLDLNEQIYEKYSELPKDENDNEDKIKKFNNSNKIKEIIDKINEFENIKEQVINTEESKFDFIYESLKEIKSNSDQLLLDNNSKIRKIVDYEFPQKIQQIRDKLKESYDIDSMFSFNKKILEEYDIKVQEKRKKLIEVNQDHFKLSVEDINPLKNELDEIELNNKDKTIKERNEILNKYQKNITDKSNKLIGKIEKYIDELIEKENTTYSEEEKFDLINITLKGHIKDLQNYNNEMSKNKIIIIKFKNSKEFIEETNSILKELNKIDDEKLKEEIKQEEEIEKDNLTALEEKYNLIKQKLESDESNKTVKKTENLQNFVEMINNIEKINEEIKLSNEKIEKLNIKEKKLYTGFEDDFCRIKIIKFDANKNDKNKYVNIIGINNDDKIITSKTTGSPNFSKHIKIIDDDFIKKSCEDLNALIKSKESKLRFPRFNRTFPRFNTTLRKLKELKKTIEVREKEENLVKKKNEEKVVKEEEGEVEEYNNLIKALKEQIADTNAILEQKNKLKKKYNLFNELVGEVKKIKEKLDEILEKTEKQFDDEEEIKNVLKLRNELIKKIKNLNDNFISETNTKNISVNIRILLKNVKTIANNKDIITDKSFETNDVETKNNKTGFKTSEAKKIFNSEYKDIISEKNKKIEEIKNEFKNTLDSKKIIYESIIKNLTELNKDIDVIYKEYKKQQEVAAEQKIINDTAEEQKKAAEEQKIINNAAAEEQKERNAVAEEKERNAAEAEMKLKGKTKEFKQKLEQKLEQNEILNKNQVRIRQRVVNNLANKLLKEK